LKQPIDMLSAKGIAESLIRGKADKVYLIARSHEDKAEFILQDMQVEKKNSGYLKSF